MTPDDTAGERRRVMSESHRLRAEARALRAGGRARDAFPLWDRIEELTHRYRDLLPDVPVARCPHTGELVRWPIDTAGLDTWFWDYLNAVRRTPQPLPPSWIAMTGAMRLTEPVETPPFAVVPGPGVPFVVPRILGAPGVRAVLAEVPVGAHTGWAVTYFGPRPPDVRLVNLWGTNTYQVFDDGVWRGWDRHRPRISEYDFALTGWLESGALRWIAPGDDTATLRTGAADCPFVDLPGSRRIAVLANGTVQHLAAFAGDGAG
ncbi:MULTISPECIES: hypothetical protein [Catenuloplanes]|uniref:Uncharacterized protein n=1 Tax=Catenuloplanes niger TaxID=587534 RepID=A0AAE3ZJJ0_9ACTN|nr:hypothetical protein [Catenuloplanes niger]MDR7319820.1 hypothetical protein [Catenuloplanes niger]